MLTPIRCGRINSIDIKIAPIVVILLLALVINSPNLLIPLIMLMVFLLAHELGHGIIAQRLGLNVTHIIITPLGGMASIEDLSQRPLDEVKVALAGPLVNLVLAAACLLLPKSMQTIAVLINLGLG
ncbi:MAG: M50 family metallopeptidase, partial [Planctomycetota bacterium]|nr:M50 family metallopeptidase [Planctomycetota bacterium]